MPPIKKLISFFTDRSLLVFLLIGGINTIIAQVGAQFMLQPISVRWGMQAGYWVSTAVMFVFTGILSFMLNRRFSFRSKAPLRQSVIRFAIILVGCYMLSFGISKITMPWILARLLPTLNDIWSIRLAILTAQGLYLVTNYTLQRLWAFKE